MFADLLWTQTFLFGRQQFQNLRHEIFNKLLQYASYHKYRTRRNFRGLPIFAVYRCQYESAKIKIAKYFPIFFKESSLDATSSVAAVTSSFPLLVKLWLFSFVPVRFFFLQVQPGARPIMTA